MITVEGEQTHTTIPAKDTINPFWNGLCHFSVNDNSVISVQIFDQKRFKKDNNQGFMGVVNFVVSSVIDLSTSVSSKTKK